MFLIVLLQSFNKISPPLVVIHTICLIGRTTLNYVLDFFTLKYLISSLIAQRSCLYCAVCNNWHHSISACCKKIFKLKSKLCLPSLMKTFIVSIKLILRKSPFLKKVIDDGSKPWACSLVGKFLGCTIPVKKVHRGLVGLWTPQEEWEIFFP